MRRRIRKVVVLGNGGWGTSLALILQANGVDTRLWCAFPEEAAELRRTRCNERYLPGIELPEDLDITADAFAAAEGVDLCLSVVPTQFLRSVADRFEDALPGEVPLASATKGLEIETFKRPDEILCDVLGKRPFCAVTGPTHAEEVARGLPASAVAASTDEDLAVAVQEALSCDSLRVYTNNDPVGAQLAGALKNVIAIAAGISDGLELGDNAKAALITRGLVEMARFGKTHGAAVETFFGLAGIGDLATTCYSKHSRNRGVGERIGRGATLEQILLEMKMVAEGVWTTKALFGPEAEGRRVAMPIAEQVHAVLFEGQDPRRAVLELMRRDLSAEMEGLELLMTPTTGFVAFLLVTVVLLGGVTLTGLRAQRRVHLTLVAAAVACLGVTIYFAEKLGELYDLESAGWITPVHLTLAKVTTLLYLAPIVTGLRLLKDPTWRPRHRLAAFTVIGMTLVTAVTGTWMLLAAQPLDAAEAGAPAAEAAPRASRPDAGS